MRIEDVVKACERVIESFVDEAPTLRVAVTVSAMEHGEGTWLSTSVRHGRLYTAPGFSNEREQLLLDLYDELGELLFHVQTNARATRPGNGRDGVKGSGRAGTKR